PGVGLVVMTPEAGGKTLRQLLHLGEIARLTSRRQLLQSGVGMLDLGVVVLGVVQLHDLTRDRRRQGTVVVVEIGKCVLSHGEDPFLLKAAGEDRKSTRLNSSHVSISYAVFCLKKKIIMIIRRKR